MTDLLAQLAALAEKVVKTPPGVTRANAKGELAMFTIAHLPAILAMGRERDALREAGQSVITQSSDFYTARNGRRCGIEGSDGEKCWIVPFDAFEELRQTLEGGNQ